MVGIFHLGSKGSPARASRSTDTARPMTPPPPPYAQNGHNPAYFATETTTTTHVVTTTQTTTHFFSLPLWRRRVQPSAQSTPASPPPKSVSTDELGVIHGTPRGLSTRDKALPPTPPNDEEPRTSRSVSSHLSSESRGTRREESSPIRRSVQRNRSATPTPSSVSPLSGTSLPETSSQGTAALARAALGLGLPPLMFNSTADPESSDANAVTFATSAPRPERVSGATLASAASMRRAKSFQRVSDDTQSKSYADIREERRIRGLSLGPLLTGSDTPPKEKTPERKSLARKSSFWSRKRNDSSAPAPIIPPPSDGFLSQPSLPSLQPVSPFNMETSISESSAVRSDHLEVSTSSELRRRHSERLPSSHTSRAPAEPGSSVPPRSKRPKRPQTAGSTGSPRATSSFFPGSISQVAEPEAIASPADTPTSTTSPSTSPAPSRPRSSTNPPFLHRLSINLFGSSPSPSPVVPNPSAESFTRSPSTSFSSTSRPSLNKSSPKVSIEIPRPRHDEESPEVYLQRLMEAVSKSEVASILAATGDEFHAKALRTYLSRFDFRHDPLDVALRRLLMDVGLPRETQQIDRVMEAFAERYRQCHPTIFVSDDHPYILAFSLIMLHTDAFNKSNKRKMTKADYVKNTRLPGVAPEVLDCFYDNIVFAPFIFIEDPLDVNGQRGLMPEGSTSRRLSTLTAPSPGGLNGSGSTLLGKSNKVDPYYLITRNLLDDLRVDIRSYIPLTSPYFYQGTGGPWDEDRLLKAFATASLVEVASENRYMASPWFGLNVGGGPSSVAMMSAPTYPVVHDVATLKVTKVGQLQRKEEQLEGGRKANGRKWKDWSVLLTGSQLLFSRDPNWATMIQTRAHVINANGSSSLPQALLPRPDEMMSLRDAIAVYDRSYTKHANTLRLALPDGRHFLLQAKDEQDMNDWIACINYAATFKTAGVRMRSLGMSGKDIELTGQAAAVSHLRDMEQQRRPGPSPRVKTWDGRTSPDVDSPQSWAEHARSPSDATSEGPITPPMESSSRIFKATFDQVKAELASGSWQDSDAISMRSGARPRAHSLESTLQSPISKSAEDGQRLSSRSRIIQSKVRDMETRLAVQQAQLDSDMRFVKNVAVLTPFQRATRDRLQLAVQNVGKRIMQIRLDMEKLNCHRDVLLKDLEAEQREWERTKNMALRAAAAKLELERKRSLPRLTFSTYLEKSRPAASAHGERSPPDVIPEQRPQSATESFHSALEFSDFSFPAEDTPQLSLSPNYESPASTPLTEGSSSPFPESPKPPRLSAQTSIDSTVNVVELDEPSRVGHEKFYTAPETPEEQAEEWNKTRAAKRVSLVRLPSDLRMSMLFGKHARNQSQAPSDESSATTTPSRSYHTASSLSPFTRTNSTIDNIAMFDI